MSNSDGMERPQRRYKVDRSGRTDIPRQHTRVTDCGTRCVDGCGHDDVCVRRGTAAVCNMLCRGLRIYERMGRVQRATKGTVRLAVVPAITCNKYAMSSEIRMEFRTGLTVETGGQMSPPHALHTWRNRHIRAVMDGFPPVHSQTWIQRNVDNARHRTCQLVLRLSRRIQGQDYDISQVSRYSKSIIIRLRLYTINFEYLLKT